jgi:hypothetical protein
MNRSIVTTSKSLVLGSFGLALALVYAPVNVGCSSAEQASSASCATPGRTGKTSCTIPDPVPGAPAKVIECSAGTLCEASSGSRQASCQPGCTSDENCGGSERCVKCDNEAVGSCRSCSLTDEQACKVTPPTPVPDAGPAMCERDTFFDSTECSGKKGYKCGSMEPPASLGPCTPAMLPGIQCCGTADPSANPCRRDNTADARECGGPLPAKAYKCFPNQDPPAVCKPGRGEPGTYCCP